MIPILDKVTSRKETPVSQIVYPRDIYKLTETLYEEHPEFEGRQSKGHRLDLGTTIFTVFPEVFFDEKPADTGYALVAGRENSVRISKWIESKYIKLANNFEKYKVVVPKTNGSGHFGEQLSSPFIAYPYHAQNTTFLSIGCFETLLEAEACLKYIKTKFARCLLSVLKVTQDNPKGVWEKIPLQDFKNNTPIDWTKSVNEIDEQLFAYYGLTESEQKFIKDTIKEMN